MFRRMGSGLAAIVAAAAALVGLGGPQEVNIDFRPSLNVFDGPVPPPRSRRKAPADDGLWRFPKRLRKRLRREAVRKLYGIPHFSKAGPGRVHRPGPGMARLRSWYGTAVTVSPRRMLVYMHAYARRRAIAADPGLLA